MVELVALDLALLKIQRDVQTAQSTETVQLVLLAGEAVPDLDVSEIDRRLLVRRLARAADQLLIVHAVVLRELVGLSERFVEQIQFVSRQFCDQTFLTNTFRALKT